jgi:hypothetical protein
LLYAYRQFEPFEIFARSQSSKYFERIKVIFDIETKDGLFPLIEAFESQKIRSPQWEFETLNPIGLLGFNQLETMP